MSLIAHRGHSMTLQLPTRWGGPSFRSPHPGESAFAGYRTGSGCVDRNATDGRGRTSLTAFVGLMLLLLLGVCSASFVPGNELIGISKHHGRLFRDSV